MDPALQSAIKGLTLPQALLLIYMRNNKITKISDLPEYFKNLEKICSDLKLPEYCKELLPEEIKKLF